MAHKFNKERRIEDGDVGIPGKKISKKQLEDWLAKSNGKSYPAAQAFAVVKKELVKYRATQKSS